MPRTKVTTRERRPAARRREPAGIATAPAYLSEIAAQDRARRLMRYEVVGKLVKLTTAHGSVEFPRESGPGIGVDADRSEFMFVTSWPALPELQDYSEEFCATCSEACELCAGKGTAPCIYTGCGGAGQRTIGIDGCAHCIKRGAISADCDICHGSGNVAILAECPCCHGTGSAQCGPCRGTGKRPTGKDAQGQTCAACRGTLRGGKWRQQDLHTLLAGKLGSYVAVGPVLRLTVKLPNGMRNQAPIRAIEFSHGDGLMVLLPINQGANPPAYFWRQRSM